MMGSTNLITESPKNLRNRVMSLVDKHNKFFSESLNLIASENAPSPSIMKVLSSDLNNRVAEGWLRESLCRYAFL